MAAPSLPWVPDRQDVIWMDCSPQAGKEMRDMHPMLLLSPMAFNETTGIVIGLPMTSASYNETNPFAVKFVVSGDLTKYVLAHQPKSFDWKKRHAKPHPIAHVPAPVFALACAALNQIISIAE